MTEPNSTPSSSIGNISRGMMVNVVIPLGLIVVAVGIFLLFGKVQPEAKPPADNSRTGRLRALPPVRVAQLQSLESTGQQLQLRVDGNVVPYREARVAAEVAGRIVEKSPECEAGNYVRKGTVLMQIDMTDQQLEYDRLKELEEQERKSIAETVQEIKNTEALVAKASEEVALQQNEVNRQESLRKERFASNSEIDQAKRGLIAAEQQLLNFENQKKLLEKRKARLESSKALAVRQLDAAKVNLDRTEIRAPISGVIVSEDADLNTFVARGNALVTIEDTSKVEVATSLRMDQLYWVLDQKREPNCEDAEGDGKKTDEDKELVDMEHALTARSYQLPETEAIIEYEMSGRTGMRYRWKGKLLGYDGIGLDPVTRTVPVRVVVDNPTEYIDEKGETQPVSGATALVRGMFVRVNLLIRPRTNLVVIPARALQPGNRVLQFVEDESVLGSPNRDVSVQEGADSGTQAQDEATSKSSKPDKDEVAFDAKNWEPGRVLVRKSVNPVDSLSVSQLGGERSDSTFAASQKMWVCETADDALTGGSYVVVSPLGSLEEGELPARAERKGMGKDKDSSAPAKSAEPTEASEPTESTAATAESAKSGDA